MFHYLLSNYRLFNNEFNRNLLFEWYHYLSVFYCHFMNFYNFLHDSISKHLYRNLSNNLGWNSSLDLDFFRYLFLYNQLYWLLFINNLISCDILNNRFLDNNFFNNLNLFYYWNFSNNLNDLKAWHLYSNNSFYNSWNFNNFLNNSWNWNYFFNYSFNLHNSWYLNYFLNDSINKDCFNSNDLFFDDNWNRNFNSDLFDDLFFNWNYSCYLLIDNSWL